MRKLITTTAMVVFTTASFSPAFAADEYNTSAGMTLAGSPLGLQGVDSVKFIELGSRIEGSAKYTYVHDDVAYYFDSKDSMKAFKKTPEAFLAQNGGFCTFGVSVGKKFNGNTHFADIVDGKLYVFLNEDIYRMYQKDKAGTIAKAEENWPKIRSTAAGDL